MTVYRLRMVDRELDELLPAIGAIALEGPKGVGKTETASRRANAVFALDDPAQRQLVSADHDVIDAMRGPVLVDEWQRLPEVWDAVRRIVDRHPRPGQFLLTGSAAPANAIVHSGAGRIVQLRMRPMSLAERGLDSPSVSLAELLSGAEPDIAGDATLTLADYAEEIMRSGFPGIRALPARARRAQLDGYLARIVEHDFPEQGLMVRRPATLRAWLSAYAAATSTSAAYNAILDAATPGESNKPAKTTAIAYRDVLSRLWLLDPVPGWLPVRNAFGRLAQAPKHHLADPALAARLLGLDVDAFLAGSPARGGRSRHLSVFGQFFESLVSLSVQAMAQTCDAHVHHLRTRGGDHEVDLIVERADQRVVALEVKLGGAVDDHDVKQLLWLRRQIGDDLLDAAVITTGSRAYRRRDGIAVIPASLLGP